MDALASWQKLAMHVEEWNLVDIEGVGRSQQRLKEAEVVCGGRV